MKEDNSVENHGTEVTEQRFKGESFLQTRHLRELKTEVNQRLKESEGLLSRQIIADAIISKCGVSTKNVPRLCSVVYV